MIRRLAITNSVGDTIVEVLIVLAILGLSFAIAAATANTGVAKGRNADEHSEATGLLTAQAELLRYAVSNNGATTVSEPFCLSGTTVTDFPSTYSVPQDPSQDDFTKYPAGCNYPGSCGDGGSVCYHESIVYSGGSGYANYDIRVRWYGIGSLGIQQVEMTYRDYPLTAGSSSGIPLSDSTAGIKVQVLEVPPDANNTTPSCQETASIAPSGASVTLQQLGNGPFSDTENTSNGSYTWTPLTDYAKFQAVFNSPPAATGSANPNGGANAQVCPPTRSSAIQAVPGQTDSNTVFKFIPLCYQATGAPYEHYGPPERYSYSTWWWHVADDDSPYRDWGPDGFGPGYSTSGYTSWESQIGISPFNDQPSSNLSANGVAVPGGYGGQVSNWSGSGYLIDPSQHGYPSTAADGYVYFQDYNYGSFSNNNWYNFFEQVVTTTDLGLTDLGNYGDPYTACPTF